MKTKTPTTSVRKAKNVTRASKPLRESKYDPIIAKIGKLKPGQALVIELPKSITPRQMQVRLASIEARRIEQGILVLPVGFRISHYETEGGNLAVELVAA